MKSELKSGADEREKSGNHTVQPVDVSLLWVFGVLALVMAGLFAAVVPLCVIALAREPGVVVIVSMLCALGMSIGLGGTGVGLIRRARRASAR